MTTKVVNIYKSPYDVYIGRAGHGQDGYFGNPFQIGKDGSRQEVIDKYSLYFSKRIDKDSEFLRKILELKDKTLGCFCKPAACHGDIIAYFIDNYKIEEQSS